jgi:nicotinamide-nucleotide amidase
MDDLSLQDLARQVGQLLSEQGLLLVTAESCTGGSLGQWVTSIPGSSGWYDRGFITYSVASKHEMLGVSESTLDEYGAVAEQTASEMAAGAIGRSHAHIAIAITGIAGPGGGTPTKPVGTMCFAWMIKDGLARAETHYFSGNREETRGQAVGVALQGAIDLLNSIPPEQV